MSGVGKGIAASSTGKILQNYGYKVTAVKIDPYVNVDAGTMNPTEHGEVFVTEDGLESDQDLGNYERFLNQNMHRLNYMTTGSVYDSVIHKERNLEYGGRCVEVVPHIPEEVIRRIEAAGKKTKSDFVIVEIGGTVGEYQNLLFLEAGRIMKLKYPGKVMFMMVSYLPIPDKIGEMKTKPTQYAVRTLNSSGIQPDFIIARASVPVDEPRKKKLAMSCNVKDSNIISAPDIESIYEVPINFEKQNLGELILEEFSLKKKGTKEFKKRTERNREQERTWEKFVADLKKLEKASLSSDKKVVEIGIVGKYFSTGKFVLSDSYISVIEAIKHAAWHFGYHPRISWLNAEDYEKNSKKLEELRKYDGLIVPGGFGSRGIEGKIKVIGFARRNNIPYYGLCYGMQLAVVEFARNVAGLKDAHTTEINSKTKHPVIDTMTEQKKLLEDKKYGGSMRLGGYNCDLINGTVAQRAYGQKNITERHRHRYEFNNKFRNILEKNGLVVSGVNKERDLVEIVEIKDHPFFVGVQFHPEFSSRPLYPQFLFKEFIRAAIKQRGSH